MSLLKRLADANRGTTAPPIEPVEDTTQGRIARAAGVRSGTILPGQMAAIPENYISGLISNEDRRPERSRLGGRDDGYMHVSSFVNACARREILAQMFHPEYFNRVFTTDRIVWAIGRAVEKHIRDQFIKANDGRGIYGQWKCLCGQLSHVGMKPDHRVTCTGCRTSRKFYYEEPIRSEEFMLTGSCDLPFMLGDYLVPVEIKSMNKDDFVKLEAPLGDHVTQVATYGELYRRAGWKVHDRAVVIYANKAYQRGSPYKEFQVDLTKPSVKRQVTLVLQAAAEVKRHREAGTIPPRCVCTSINSKAAKDCATVASCWNLDG